MAKVRVMYWKEIPVQVQATDSYGTISKPLEPRFQEAADAISMFDGSSESDDYLMGWHWGDEIEIEGNAKNVAEKIAEKYNLLMPKDFVARIRDLHKTGNRSEIAGSIDNWMDQHDK